MKSPTQNKSQNFEEQLTKLVYSAFNLFAIKILKDNDVFVIVRIIFLENGLSNVLIDLIFCFNYFSWPNKNNTKKLS